MHRILPIDTPTLGDRSYLVHDGQVAFVIDPQRDIDRVLTLAAAENVAITHVFETHIHNDYVTGGHALAHETGAAYHVNADDSVAFDRIGVRDGDVITVGDRMRVRVTASPGHTFTHLSYVLEVDDNKIAAFTGGSLLYGSVGRPDLLGRAHTHALVHHQYASAQRLAEDLPDAAGVYPTHGFGSFCSATQSDATFSTIGAEKRVNPALTKDEQHFVDDLLAGLDAWPAYYAHMAPANSRGPAAPDLTRPAHADAAQLRTRLAAGEWVVDLRNRIAFAAGHVAGTLNFGLDGSFATYLGWLIPWDTPLTLLGDTPEQVAAAQRELVRIGIDRPAAHATGTPADWAGDRELASFPRATFADLAQVRHHRPVALLDVRRDLEAAEAHIDGATHIPLHQLLERLDEVPDGEIWVHCAAGYRASIATSILARAGRRVVAIDDDFVKAVDAGLPIMTADARRPQLVGRAAA
jgi:glyoxylase-like metal-dependent hydrolase (beta-lactamase superfamily II)/rhodanese-related sulfurtransferase